ncbi:hypothetical protein HU200_043583 [Digitaria exilis]|uniref:Peroxidase n=1 Tax=Digitaria exilis TaxID=1010633 RepID=A0A835B2W7_9POAL|nr:hypothetical protein HU200_043583 [Digitaria exilis]
MELSRRFLDPQRGKIRTPAHSVQHSAQRRSSTRPSRACGDLARRLPTQRQPIEGGYYNDKKDAAWSPFVRDEVYKTLNYDRSKGPPSKCMRVLANKANLNVLARVVMHPTLTPREVAGSNIGLRAFDVIDKNQGQARGRVPGVVSCADILAFRGPDGHIDYARRLARQGRDDTLPSSTGSFPDLKKNFGNKGFDVEELVVLSGAHSIGVAHYPSFKDRLAAPQSEIDANKNKSRTVANDIRDESYSFKRDAGYYTVVSGRKDYLNNTYYHNAMDNRVLFKSDWVLRTDAFALSKLKEYRDKPKEWDSDFADAMVKLGKLLPAEGEGLLEIRRTTGTKGAL